MALTNGSFLLKLQHYPDCFIEYTSPKLSLNFSGFIPELQVVDYNGIIIAEKYGRAENPFDNYGEYYIILSLKVNEQNINERQQVTKICEDINRFSSFVTGTPWQMKSKTYFGSNKLIIADDDVDGWMFKIMKRDLPMEIGEGIEMLKPSMKFREKTHPPITVEKSPLKELMHFIQNENSKNKRIPPSKYIF